MKLTKELFAELTARKIELRPMPMNCWTACRTISGLPVEWLTKRGSRERVLAYVTCENAARAALKRWPAKP